MTQFGYFLSSEELSPRALVEAAKRGEQSGFASVLVSDHYHPWLESQGESPFVWSMLGAIASSTDLQITTGVTCPIIRIHPAVLAQAAATTQLLSQGRFRFGVGSGENLNEHILGHRWPPPATRLDMLREAIDVIRQLWKGGYVTHHGRYYTVENARIFSLPEAPPPILISGFGPEATELAAQLGDGYVNTSPTPELPDQYRKGGGSGPAVAAIKVCWNLDESAARKLVHDRWKSSGLPGQLAQELALPSHFEAGAELVTVDQMAKQIPCGPDPERHADAIRAYVDAGYDEIFIAQVGDDQEGFQRFFADEVRPRL